MIATVTTGRVEVGFSSLSGIGITAIP